MIPIQLRMSEEGAWVDLWEIFEPNDSAWQTMTDAQKVQYAISHLMYPSEVKNTAETYSRDAERTADYELENLIVVNAKSKPEFTWDYLKVDYAARLLDFLNYTMNYKDVNGDLQPIEAPIVYVKYRDFIGMREIKAYLGQTIEGVLKELQIGNSSELYWEQFRIAFPER